MAGVNYKAYTGNNDFRGFLASQAPGLLAYTGNDGGIDQNAWMQSQYGKGNILGDNAAQVRFARDPNGQDNFNTTKSAISNLYKNWSAAQGGGNASAPTSSGSVSYASSSTPTIDPNVVAQFDTAIGTTQSALNRLPSQLAIARGNINSQYNTNVHELDSSKNQAQNSYGTSTLQNKQNYRGDKNQIADAASSGLRGLMRTLGAYGAGGSSDAMYVAPQAVAQQASMERAGAGQNYAQNAQSLDTNWNNFLEQDKNSREKLNDWRTQQTNSATAQSDTTKQSLLSKLADIMGQKAAYQGGSYQGAAQPLIDQANALSGTIDNLAKINPTYNGVTPVYNAPSLGSYEVNPNTQTQFANATEQTATPYLSLLLGGNRDRNQLGF